VSEEVEVMKDSELVILLEELEIGEYTLYSNHYKAWPKRVEFENKNDYYKLINHLRLENNKWYEGSPNYYYELTAKHKGWVFASTE
jgi:hypothetical protein